MRRWRVAGINFDHPHMADLLRHVAEHERADIVGVAHRERAPMERAIADLGVPEARVFGDERACLEATEPDLVLLCPATGEHADWTERVAPYGVHVLIEKPFAASVAEAERMIAALERSGRRLAVNWPLRWYPPHATTKRLIDEGAIGEVREVHYYDGNRGPVRPAGGGEASVAEKAESWFYRRERGGGSLLDYLGYGVTLGSWFNGGAEPLEVTAVAHAPAGLEVDEHSVSVVRYATGLSTFETRWGTFTDPWEHPPQPRCGFVVVGSAGTITSYDYAETVRLQTAARPEGERVPVDALEPPFQNPVQYLLHCLESGEPIEGPLAPELCLLGQRIVDAALRSAREGRTVAVA